MAKQKKPAAPKKSEKVSHWFVLEPYVHLAEKKGNWFFYNTLNGRSLLIDKEKSPAVAKIIRQWRNKKKLFVAGISPSELKNPHFRAFAKKMRSLFMADLLDKSLSQTKPVQLIPMLKVLKGSQSDAKKLAESPAAYVREVSLYVNGQCDLDCACCGKSYRQFPHCRKSADAEARIDVGWLKDFFQRNVLPKLLRINVLGGDVFSYPNFSELADFLNQLSVVQVCYFMDYRQLLANFAQASLLKEKISDYKVFSLHIFFSPSVKREEVEKIQVFVKDKAIEHVFNMIVQSEEECNHFTDLVAQCKIEKFVFKPFFNGNNLAFFSKNVFTCKGELLRSKPAISDILARTIINSANFGKVIVESNLDVYANLNQPLLGSLKKDSIARFIYKELTGSQCWRQTRNQVAPCRHCHYELLCPPISNYEYALKRYDLCKIKPSNTKLLLG